MPFTQKFDGKYRMITPPGHHYAESQIPSHIFPHTQLVFDTPIGEAPKSPNAPSGMSVDQTRAGGAEEMQTSGSADDFVLGVNGIGAACTTGSHTIVALTVPGRKKKSGRPRGKPKKSYVPEYLRQVQLPSKQMLLPQAPHPTRNRKPDEARFRVNKNSSSSLPKRRPAGLPRNPKKEGETYAEFEEAVIDFDETEPTSRTAKSTKASKTAIRRERVDSPQPQLPHQDRLVSQDLTKLVRGGLQMISYRRQQPEVPEDMPPTVRSRILKA